MEITKYIKQGIEKVIVQFVDCTYEVLQGHYKSKNVLLGMINACVSHELRNPLNSIIA